MRVVAIANQKGGVGKTTTVVNVGAGLSRLGKKVLLVDLDPQAHLTESLGLAPRDDSFTIYEFMKGEAPFGEVTVESHGMKVIPSALELSGAEMELASVTGREFLLREALEGVDGFDWVLLDCPPNLGILTVNALVMAREVFIPLQTEYLAMKGLKKLLETVEIVRKRLNGELAVTGIIGTRYDARKRLNREVLDLIREHFGDRLFKTLIRDNVALAEAPSHRQDIFNYRPNSHGADDYMNLCKEIIAGG